MPTLSQPPAELVTPIHRLEVDLLLCCARTQLNPAIVEQIQQLLNQEIDWHWLIQLAARQKILPLLYHSLTSNHISSATIPPHVLTTLQHHFYTNIQRNLFQTGALIKLLKILDTQGIPVIPFKGPILATAVYGNLALRRFNDLDIWVRSQDLAQVQSILEAEGYQMMVDRNWEHSFCHPTTQVSIDLHIALTPQRFPVALQFEQVRSRLQRVTLAGMAIPHFCPEDLLLILCIKWGKDCWELKVYLAQLCDIAEVLRTYPDLDWNWLIQQAQALGCERMLLFALSLTQAVLGIDLPAPIVEPLITNSAIQALTTEGYSRIWQNLLHEPEPLAAESSTTGILYDHRLYYTLRERWRDRSAYFLYSIFVPTEQETTLLPLPRELVFLYYPLRLVRLISKYGRRLFIRR